MEVIHAEIIRRSPGLEDCNLYKPQGIIDIWSMLLKKCNSIHKDSDEIEQYQGDSGWDPDNMRLKRGKCNQITEQEDYDNSVNVPDSTVIILLILCALIAIIVQRGMLN